MLWKEKEKKSEENKTNFKAHILRMDWQIPLKFETEGAPLWIHSYRKFCMFLFRECWATDSWKQSFPYSCKIHPCLLRALGFMGRTTQCHISWFRDECEVTISMSHPLQTHWYVDDLERSFLFCSRYIFPFNQQKWLGTKMADSYKHITVLIWLLQ